MGNVTVTSNVNTRNLTATGTLAAGNTTITGTLSSTGVQSVSVAGGVNLLTLTSTNNYSFLKMVGTGFGGEIDFFNGATALASVVGTTSNALDIYAGTNAATKVGSFSGTGLAVTGSLLAGTGSFRQGSVNPEQVAGTQSTSSFLTTTGSNWVLGLLNNSTTPYGLGIAHNTDSNGTGNEFLYLTGAGTLRMSVRSNGGVVNVQANDANTSDVRLKKNIELAGNYLDKICAIPVKTFLYKDQTDEFLNLGVIAQDVEAVAPELIDSSGVGETPEDGIPLKGIYQTDLQYALMKAIQELAAKVAKLEAA